MTDKKSEALGLNYSTATNALRKQIIWHLAGILGLLTCHQCGQEVELEQFSIEHKVAWMQTDDPKASFFDMNNIAFSHQPCNSGAASRPTKLEPDELIRRRRAGGRKYYKEHREERNAYRKEYYAKHKDNWYKYTAS